jgi:hypothetical protein
MRALNAIVVEATFRSPFLALLTTGSASILSRSSIQEAVRAASNTVCEVVIDPRLKPGAWIGRRERCHSLQAVVF